MRFGYSTANSASSRHRALVPAVKAYGSLSVFQKLNALYVLNMRTNPATARIARADRNWVKKVYMEKR